MAVGSQNPFYIQPASPDISPILTGIGSLIKDSREKQKSEKLKQGLMTAYQSGDPEAVAAFMSENPESGKTLDSMLNFRSGASKANYVDAIKQSLTNETPENIKNVWDSRVQYLKSQGIPFDESASAFDNYMADPEAAKNSALSELAGLDNPSYKAYKERMGGGDPEFNKEERKSAAQDVRSFNTKARAMRTSYGQLQGLADQARGNDRGAKNAMTVTLARLISPGIVTEAEAAGLSGGQSIMQYVLQRASTGDANTDNVLKSLDPYGDSFDPDAMLKIGESVVASGRKPLIDMYEGSRSRAERAKMGKRAFNTNFGDNQNYEFLQGFGADEVIPETQQQAVPEGSTATNPATGEKVVYTNGEWRTAP